MWFFFIITVINQSLEHFIFSFVNNNCWCVPLLFLCIHWPIRWSYLKHFIPFDYGNCKHYNPPKSLLLQSLNKFSIWACFVSVSSIWLFIIADMMITNNNNKNPSFWVPSSLSFSTTWWIVFSISSKISIYSNSFSFESDLSFFPFTRYMCIFANKKECFFVFIIFLSTMFFILFIFAIIVFFISPSFLV